MMDFLIPVTLNVLPSIDTLQGRQGMFILPDGSININTKLGTWFTINKRSDHRGVIKSDTVITPVQGEGIWFWASEGVYPYAGNVSIAKFGIISYNGNTWASMEVELPESKAFIPTFSTMPFPISGDVQVTHLDRYWELRKDKTALITDIPSDDSLIWKNLGGAGFSEEEFNKEAQKYGSIGLISDDVSNSNFTLKISAGAGSSIGTYKATAQQIVKKIRIKVANAGLGTFTYFKGNQAINTIVSNVPLVAGWNEVTINDFILEKDFIIGYSTASSTAELYYFDGGSGVYYGSNGFANAGHIAVEIYSVIGYNKFKDVVTPKDLSISTFDFKKIRKNTTPDLRKLDYGVISYFPDIKKADLLGNNTVTVENASVTADFNNIDKKYIYSIAFDIDFGAKLTTTKEIATIKINDYKTITITAGGVGISVNVHEANGITYDYGNKKVSFVIIADAYYTMIYVNGIKIGAKSIARKMSMLKINISQADGQTVKNLCYWNRKISNDRMIEWNENANPFTLNTAEDKVYPQEGYQISDNLVKSDNPYFLFAAEQNIVKFKDKFFLYSSLSNSDPHNFVECGIGVSISAKVNGGYDLYTQDAVIGGMRNKAGVTRAMACWAGVKDNTMYVFAALDYTNTTAGGAIFKSSTGKDFTKVNDIVIPQISFMANMGFWQEKQPDNYYYGLVEGKENGIWQIYLVRSLNFESGWEFVQKVTSLQNGDGRMCGGPKLMRTSNDDRWIVVYHSSHEVAGNEPTALFVAECMTPVPNTFINKRKILDITDELDFYSAYNCDQTATPHIIEENGKTYLSYVLAQNLPTLHCQIRISEFDGNKEELFGIVPMNI